MTSGRPEGWIDELEISDAQVKWGFSHFDGRADIYNEEGEYNFVLILDEATAKSAHEDGWNVREKEPYEEGDPMEHQLKVKISDKFGLPMMYLIKNGRKMRMHDLRDLHDIRRDTCLKLDVILSPSRWTSREGVPGVTAYVKELYATVKESRFAADYADMDEI